MPEGTIAFDVAAPVEEVWSFLSDMRQVGRCVPGVDHIEILDATHARWDLTVKIGPLSQTLKVLTETLEQVPLRHGRFRAEAENIDMIGTIDLTPTDNGTKIVYTMAVNAKGPLARIMDNFMRTKLKSQTEAFAASVKQALEPETRSVQQPPVRRFAQS
jgi:carbon monoxide dehydrogenase subunit G